jgi:Fe2+ or Zn2+ uptake regulation protein
MLFERYLRTNTESLSLKPDLIKSKPQAKVTLIFKPTQNKKSQRAVKMPKSKWFNKTIDVTPRDREILNFIWRHKVVTSSAVHSVFFKGTTAQTAYRRLRKLQNFKFVHPEHNFRGRGCAWTLTTKGFKYILEELGRLTEQGFKSESVDHDLLVAAALTGPWISEKPKWG